MKVIGFLFCVMNCCYGQDSAIRFQIDCHIDGIPDGTKFYMIKSNIAKMPDTFSYAEAKEGLVHMEGVLDKEGQFIFIKLDTSLVKIATGNRSYLRLLIEDGATIVVDGNLAQWPNVKITGSEATNRYEEFLKLNSKFKSERNSLAISSMAEYKKFLLDYAVANPNCFVSPFCVLNASSEMSLDEIQTAYNGLNERVKRSYYGILLSEKVGAELRRGELGLGKSIPDFEVQLRDGKKVWIKSIISQSKYTLLDFWAWWCGPCKEDVPEMKRVYEYFKDSGFNIIGVSIDLDKKKWHNAIDADGTNWTHVLDIGKASKSIFGIGAVPAYLLVDSDGVVIFEDCGISIFSKQMPRYQIENEDNLRKSLFPKIKKVFSVSTSDTSQK